MRKVILNEQQLQQLEQIILEVPTKWGNPLLNILGQGLQTTTEDPILPVGGGGGSPIKPTE